MIRLFSILSAITLAFAPVSQVSHSEGGSSKPQMQTLSAEGMEMPTYFANRQVQQQIAETIELDDFPQLPDAPVKLDQAPPAEDEIYYTEAQIEYYRNKMEEEQEKIRAAEEERLRQEQKQKELEQLAEESGLTIQELKEMGLDETAQYFGTCKLTAYCPCYLCCGKYPDDPGYGLTASGEMAQEGITIAMDKLPFGTRVYIENVGIRVVQDRGGAIKGNRIDIFCSTHERCFENPNYAQSAAKVWILPDEEENEEVLEEAK